MKQAGNQDKVESESVSILQADVKTQPVLAWVSVNKTNLQDKFGLCPYNLHCFINLSNFTKKGKLAV